MEQGRLNHDLRAAEDSLRLARSDWSVAKVNLNKALALLTDIQNANGRADGDIRRVFNQVVFAGVLIDAEDYAGPRFEKAIVGQADLTEGWS